MPLQALAITLLAAVLHAGWNYLAKSSKETPAFLWFGVFFGAIGYGFYIIPKEGLFFPPFLLPLFALSLAAEAGYLVTLVRGYRQGDLSLVYPISRGSPPVFLALWSAIFLGERLPVLGYVGIAVIVVGIYLASLRSGPHFLALPFRDPSAVWALISAFFISVYSLSDKLIVASMSPLQYNWWVYAGNTVVYAPLVWSAATFARNTQELRLNLIRILTGSAMTVLAYVFVLSALTMTSASYVVAVRGTSVMIGALLGWLVLREGLGWLRVVGASLMVVGLGLITFAH